MQVINLNNVGNRLKNACNLPKKFMSSSKKIEVTLKHLNRWKKKHAGRSSTKKKKKSTNHQPKICNSPFEKMQVIDQQNSCRRLIKCKSSSEKCKSSSEKCKLSFKKCKLST